MTKVLQFFALLHARARYSKNNSLGTREQNHLWGQRPAGTSEMRSLQTEAGQEEGQTAVGREHRDR